MADTYIQSIAGYNPNGGGGSGVTSVGTIDSQTPSADALVISGSEIFAQTVSTSNPGMMSSTDKTKLNSLSAPQGPTVNAWVYVSQQGSDITGDGSYNKPFATTAAAQAIITDASTSKRYGIHIRGTITETNIYLAPYTWYYGDTWGCSRLNATSNNITLDPTKYTTGNSRSGMTNIYLTGSTGVSLDFVAVSASGSHVVEMDNIGINGNITINPNNQNQYFQWLKAFCFGNVTLHGALGFLFDFFVLGNTTVDQMATPASTGGVNFQNCLFGGNFSQSSDGVHTNPVQLTGCTIAGTATVTGATTVLTVDSISLPLKAQVALASGGSLVRTTDAYSMAYTPAVSGNWNSQPSTIQQALDMIAASVGPI